MADERNRCVYRGARRPDQPGRVDPGDWVAGDPDGGIVVPSAIVMDALLKTKEIERREEGMRQDLAGMSFEDACRMWGRA